MKRPPGRAAAPGSFQVALYDSFVISSGPRTYMTESIQTEIIMLSIACLPFAPTWPKACNMKQSCYALPTCLSHFDDGDGT